MRSQSGPDSTPAPSLASSVCMAWMRSVSLTRQLPMLRRRHGPSAYSARAAAVMAASGIRLKSARSEEHTSELQSLMRNSYADFCLKKKKKHRQKLEYHTKNNN